MSDAIMALCDACGLPPRAPNKPLLKCTRCNQAHYHDRRCQQNHYPKHKAECRRVAAAAKKAGTAPSAVADAPIIRKPLVECRTIEGRGRSLIATSKLHVGCHPMPTRDGDGLCEPIAHPVLIESMRSSRCAYCFQLIHNLHFNDTTTDLHYHCSPKCRSLDKNCMAETYAMQKLPSPPSPTALSCARILRKFKESPTTLEEYNQLCWNIDLLSQQEKESYLSTMAQCHAFLCAMEDRETAKIAHDLLHPTPTPAYQFMSRLSMNGFTVSNSEQLPVGHGVYLGASTINHSCRPNAVPTFWLRPSTPPMLQITVCQTVLNAGEVTISYCDTSTPMFITRDSLWNNYKFVCECLLCKDRDRDDEVVGLKCTTDGCQGTVRSIAASDGNDSISDAEYTFSGEERAKNKSRYQCNSCGNVDFDHALKAQADSMEKMKRFESEMKNNIVNHTFQKKAGEESRAIYERLKRYCHVQRSYYSAWSADLFVCWCANALKSCTNEQEQLGLCHEALVVINESRSASKFCMEGNILWNVKRGMEAKLRLFANPMDMEALGLLRNVKKEMLVYYPSCDVTIMSLDESLAAYSFS